jgi:HSP20 family molecular chaperone IbpA
MGEIFEICDVATLAWRDLLASNHLDDPDRPVLALEERPETYRLCTYSPGLQPEHIQVQAERHVLKIEGTLHAPAPSWDLLAPLRAAPEARFARVFRLKSPIDPDRSRVSVNDGMLEITLVKVQSESGHPVAC